MLVGFTLVDAIIDQIEIGSSPEAKWTDCAKVQTLKEVVIVITFLMIFCIVYFGYLLPFAVCLGEKCGRDLVAIQFRRIRSDQHEAGGSDEHFRALKECSNFGGCQIIEPVK